MTEKHSKDEPELDSYTKDVLERGISRRSFLTHAAVGAATVGVMGLGALASTSAEAAESKGKGAANGGEFAKSSDGGATLNFMPKPKPIAEKDIKETLVFDVVVVGAGAAGVPAALSALEAGAKVAVLQKAPFAVSQGNSGTGIDLDKSDKAGIEALVSLIIADNSHRSDPKLVRQWAYHSGEAVRWVMDRAKKGGSPVVDQANLQQGAIMKVNGYPMSYITSFFGPKPYTTGDGMRHLAKYAEQAGVKFFYLHPAHQLVLKDGAVVGVIARNSEGKYVRFMAKKGVILATGDYQNNKAMSEYFLPDLKYLGRKQMDKTGDGFQMAFWAGGVIDPIGHTKMLHDFDAGPATMCDMPFLAVNRDGKRFVNECAEMSVLNNYLKSKHDAGQYCQIFDADYMTQGAKWPGVVIPPQGLKNYMPDEPGAKKGVFPSFINTFSANTLEELARKLELPADALVATVKRYNEMVAAGRDEDFGKPADKMAPVVKAPFYGIHRTIRISAIVSGMLVDEHHNALNADGKPIKGLYLAGNLSGGFYGGIDYPLTVYGLSLGRCYTIGFLTGKHVASL